MNKHFHIQLKEERTRRGWTQAELARRTGMTRSQISHLESSSLCPTYQQRASLLSAMHLPKDTLGYARPLSKPGGWPRWLRGDLWERFLKRPGRYRLDRDRENWTRLRAGKKQYRRIYDQLSAACQLKHGRQVLRDLFHFGCIESGLEAIAIFQTLLTGIVSYVPLSRLGWRRMPVVEHPSGDIVGDRLWPVIVIEQPFLCALFLQVRLQVPENTHYRLDFLACVKLEDGLHWVDIEVDGTGHDPTKDKIRTAQLRLPRVTLEEDDVLATDFPSRLQQKILQAIDRG